MSEKKTAAEYRSVLILTDDAESTAAMAEEIAGALKEHDVKLRTASVFEGTDLLPAEAFFIGCEKPGPPSFVYIEKLLKHINLAGRSCGIFSPEDAGAVEYLLGLVRDCGASVKYKLIRGPSWTKNLTSMTI